jgi:capsular polysaccharide biosynthesis protein
VDLRAYVNPVIKWWWLILAAGIVAALSSTWIVLRQEPVYAARTTLIVGRAVFELNPNSNDLWLNQQLASYYADIANRQQVQSETMAALGISWLPHYTVRPLPNSQIIEIIVNDFSPLRAQAVANELANQLIQQSPGSAQAADNEPSRRWSTKKPSWRS